MLYKMIEKKQNEWYKSNECTVKELISYIQDKGFLRDAQIEAIKTYMFLKIACENKPLWELFVSGKFNSLNVDELELKTSIKDMLKTTASLLALYEYATLKNDKNEQVSVIIEKAIKDGAKGIDSIQVFKDLFYNINYTDYLFSLPMGAGKTYLMAAFIYLDLYFALNEPYNNSFAHNFIILAPSGLKSSVVPSLKTIQKFEPSWLFPEPAASNIKKIIRFEILDSITTAKKSNKTKNPNVQKISMYQPFDGLIGLVAVTNAEKVIIDKVFIDNGQISFLTERPEDRKANELRTLIGKIPHLSIFVDEVHHASDEDIKLRGVVSNWMQEKTVNSVIGFSGTPYLDAVRPVEVGMISHKKIELSNVVFYYPLIKGINNFLKKPLVHISSSVNSMEIVENGIRDFLDKYKDIKYNGVEAKLAIYCGQIIPLMEDFLPLAEKIVAEYGISADTILPFYGKDSKGKYICPAHNEVEFSLLDTIHSKKKIILLAQIGKEGWDCKSLTGVILS